MVGWPPLVTNTAFTNTAFTNTAFTNTALMNVAMSYIDVNHVAVNRENAAMYITESNLKQACYRPTATDLLQQK